MVAEPVGVPVHDVRLEEIEQLIAEGVRTLDLGQEGLAYHIFAKATQQRAPRGIPAAELVDVMKRAWFWRAKTAETVDDVVFSLEKALELEPGNLQMQAQLAWAKQRLEREQKVNSAAQESTDKPVPVFQYQPPQPPQPTFGTRLGELIRVVGGMAALVLAVLWLTTGLVPALGRALASLPVADQSLIHQLLLTINGAALPGHGHLALPVVDYDLGLSLPFVLAFLFIFTARGLMDGDVWARRGGLLAAGAGAWLCIVAVSNPEAGRLGLALCGGIILASIAGKFEAPNVLPNLRGAS
mgnify:CR=1 FL=1